MRLRIVVAVGLLLSVVAVSVGAAAFVLRADSSAVDASSLTAADVQIELGSYGGPTEACFTRPSPGEQSSCLMDLSAAATSAGDFGPALAILREGVSRSEDMVGRCHNETHDVGWALAEAGMPLREIYRIQFPDCRFGFYHGGMTQTAEDMSLEELIAALPTLCADFGPASENSTQECVHATGHLVTDRMGTDLAAAVEACGAFTEAALQGRCTDGVLMQAVDLARPGVEDPNDPAAQRIVDTWGATAAEQERSVVDLCDSLPNGDMTYVCYTNVSQTLAVLWQEDYAEVTRVCEQVADAQWRRACFEGVAASAFTLRSWDPRGIADACHASQSPDTKYCMASMAHSFGIQDVPERAKLVCDLARGYEKKECLRGLRDGTRISQELSGSSTTESFS